VGVFDELPRPLPPDETASNRRVVASDIAFGRKMEEKLPPGSMLFELPVMSFPEAVPIHDAAGYEMLRPYLVTKTLRFTFGAIRGRNREAWQWEVEKMPAPEMIKTLEQYGFSAIFINRKGFADHGADLLKQLAAADRSETFEDDIGEQLCVRLHPSASPVLPRTDERADILFTSGWSIKEQTALENREWSSGNASLTFFSESRQPTPYSFRCVIGSLSSRHVSLMMDGREIWASEIGANQGAPVDVTVTGRHGNNKIELLTDAGPDHSRSSPLPLAFTLVNLQITRLQ
jgi:phosphoglycerol transferase